MVVPGPWCSGTRGLALMTADLWRKQWPQGFTSSPQAPRRARKRAEGTASSNVFSMFDQSQIQEFKEVGRWPWGHWAPVLANFFLQPRHGKSSLRKEGLAPAHSLRVLWVRVGEGVAAGTLAAHTAFSQKAERDEGWRPVCFSFSFSEKPCWPMRWCRPHLRWVSLLS